MSWETLGGESAHRPSTYPVGPGITVNGIQGDRLRGVLVARLQDPWGIDGFTLESKPLAENLLAVFDVDGTLWIG